LAFPAPISFVGYAISIVKWLRKNKQSGRELVNRRNWHDEQSDNDDDDELFLEKKFAENYLHRKEMEARESVIVQIKNTAKKLEELELKLNKLQQNGAALVSIKS
jgi:hypothetical protein